MSALQWVLLLGNYALVLDNLCVLHWVLRAKQKKIEKPIFIFLAVLTLVVCIYFANHTESSTNSPFLVLQSCFFLYIFLSFSHSIWQKLVYFFVNLIVNMVTGMLVLPILELLDSVSTEMYYFLGTSVNVLVYWLVWQAFLCIQKRFSERTLPKRVNIWSALFLVGQGICMTSVILKNAHGEITLADRYAFFSLLGSPIFSVIWIGIMAFIIFGDAAAVISMSHIAKNQQEQNQLQLLTYQAQQSKETVAAMQKERDRAGQLVQTMECTLQEASASATVPLRAVSESLQALTAEFLPNSHYTENTFLNAVLYTELQGLCVPNSEVCIRLPEEICGMDKYDLCRVFSNLLRNAKQALSALPQEKRVLYIESYTENGFLFIKTENSINDGEKSKATHTGLGLGICRQIAQQYNGTFVTQVRDGRFQVLFVAQLPAEGNL